MVRLSFSEASRIQKEAVERRHKEEMEKFPIPNQDSDEPIPCDLYPGYFYIPWADSRIVINRDGEMIKLLTGKPNKYHFNSKGYRHTTLRVNRLWRGTPVHRIVAMIFCKVPERHLDKSYQDLEVNHKDGNIQNNNDKNLEWVTTYENMMHAWETGLVGRETPVLVRTEDWVVTRHVTLYEAARLHNVSPQSLRKHLISIFSGMIMVDGFYFKFDDGSPWTRNIAVKDTAITIGMQCDCIGENVETGKKLIFTGLRQACSYLKLNLISVHNTRCYKGIDVPYKGWIFYSMTGRPLSRKNRGK